MNIELEQRVSIESMRLQRRLALFIDVMVTAIIIVVILFVNMILRLSS